MVAKPQNLPSLRVIGGQWRRRKLHFVATADLRPTGDRARETLFNWLQWDIRGSRCLDLFAGSGALGFEAASRGATRVVMVECGLSAARQLSENCRQLRADQIEVVHGSADHYLQRASQPFDIIFLDPPFALQKITAICAALEQHRWLIPHALVYIEAQRWQDYQVPNGWMSLKSSRAGQVALNLYRSDGG